MTNVNEDVKRNMAETLLCYAAENEKIILVLLCLKRIQSKCYVRRKILLKKIKVLETNYRYTEQNQTHKF